MFGRSACACATADVSESPATVPSTTEIFLFISPTSPWLRRQRSRAAAPEPDRRQPDGGRRRRDGCVALQAGRAGGGADREAGGVVGAAAHLERARRGGAGQHPLLDVAAHVEELVTRRRRRLLGDAHRR